MAAIYQADIFCDDCADCIKRRIAAEAIARNDKGPMAEFLDGEDWEGLVDAVVEIFDSVDHRDYDSGDYPKGCSDDEESDSPQHCGSHDDCINYGELADGFRYGYCFGNSLTSDGVEYVREAVRDGEPGGVARELWAVEYDWIDFDERDDDDDYNDC